VDAIAVVEDEVRELVRRRGLDPARDVAAIRRLVDDVIADYDERTLSGAMPALADRGTAARSVYDAVAGFGPLQPYLDDPEVEEIWVNDPGRVFVARRGRSELTTTILRAAEIRDLVEKMLKSSGRRVDLSTPFVDATLPDGSRLHVVIPDITRQHWAVNTDHSFLYYFTQSGRWAHNPEVAGSNPAPATNETAGQGHDQRSWPFCFQDQSTLVPQMLATERVAVLVVWHRTALMGIHVGRPQRVRQATVICHCRVLATWLREALRLGECDRLAYRPSLVKQALGACDVVFGARVRVGDACAAMSRAAPAAGPIDGVHAIASGWTSAADEIRSGGDPDA
jgi:hypothetical protein